MRRSLAPSQIKQRASLGISSSRTDASSKSNTSKNDEVTIQRLPLFGFLSIPNDLKKPFKIPSGCVISEENIALRRRKTLGQRRMPLVVPGGYVAPLPRVNIEDTTGEEEEESSSKTSEFPPHEPVILWTDPDDETNVVQVIPQLACRLRPHQREGVQFLFECTMGLRGFEGEGCILADDMGLGKTLMSLTLLWTLLNQGKIKGKSAVQKAIVVCPTSLVGNWENELRKWIGDHCPIFPVKSDPQKMIKNFIGHRSKAILIISYETQRRYCDMFTANNGKGQGGYTSCCELLICDEAHKLKNADSGLSKSLNLLPAKKRVLLSGTPMQNELTEFFNMVNFCNPNVLGNLSHFRKKYENPILRAREPDASPRHIEKAEILQKELSTIVNEFILKRGNILNAQHLPPKLVQFVCCKLTPLQEKLYDCVLNSKEARHLRDGKQTNTLNSLRHMLSICSHPDLILSSYRQKHAADNSSAEDEVLEELNSLMLEYNASNGPKNSVKAAVTPGGGGRADRAAMRKIKMSNGFGAMSSARSGFDPERSGKFLVLSRLMSTLRNTSRDRIVVVSNSTQTLDLVESMCNDNNWPQLRLDGSIASQKRTKLVDIFNDSTSNAFAFLLSSKAGGCGINLIGGNRLVMMDPDWNPASDKQAAARIWREGQQKRCYIYRLMSTCTIEEKIIQRQLSKEGLQSIVDNTDQVNSFSSNELKSLFQRDNVLDTRSNTHDTLRCKRCKCVTQITASAHKNGNNALLQKHATLCISHLTKLIESIEHIVSVNIASREGAQGGDMTTVTSTIGGQRADVAYTLDVKLIKQDLERDVHNIPFKTVPELSKRIRTVIMGVDQDLKDEFGVQNVTLFNDFVASWTELVPQLQDISKEHNKAMKTSSASKTLKTAMDVDGKENFANGEGENDNNEDGDGDDDGDEYVEQEGCPEEEDFNRWSHHSSVRTCYGDESLQKAMSMGDNDDHGDNTISFVFGLEVNWDLLQEKMAKHAERDEQRRLQLEADLQELNRKRDEARRRESEGPSEFEESNESFTYGEKSKKGGKKKKKKQSVVEEFTDEIIACIDESSSDEDDHRIECEDLAPVTAGVSEQSMPGDRKKKKKKKKRHSEDRSDKHRSKKFGSFDDESSGCDDCFLDEKVGQVRKMEPSNNVQNKRSKVVVIDDSDSDCMSNGEGDGVTDTCWGNHPSERRRRSAVCDDSDKEDYSVQGALSNALSDRHHVEDVDAMSKIDSVVVDEVNEQISCEDDAPCIDMLEDKEEKVIIDTGSLSRGDGLEGSQEKTIDNANVLTWVCVSCTFLNTYPARLCEVCGCRKPRTGSSQDSLQSFSGTRHKGSSVTGGTGKPKGRLALPTRKKKGVVYARKI